MAFEKPVPQWHAEGAEPPESLKASGFTGGYQPPADFFNWFWHGVSEALTEMQSKIGDPDRLYSESNPPSAEDTGALPLTGGELSGELIVNENFHVRKSFDGIPYRSYIRPVNYELGGEYSTGLIHYNNGVNDAQLMFNKNGIMLRDNVNKKAYQIFGQHNADSVPTKGSSNVVTSNAVRVALDNMIDVIYPVGSIYMSVNNVSPATLFGGTWEQIKDTFLLSAGDTYAAGATGGEAEHTLTTSEIPEHRHPTYNGSGWAFFEVNRDGTAARTQVATSTSSKKYTFTSTESGDVQWPYNATGKLGGNGAHNNMPPYLAVYVWKRTA